MNRGVMCWRWWRRLTRDGGWWDETKEGDGCLRKMSETAGVGPCWSWAMRGAASMQAARSGEKHDTSGGWMPRDGWRK